MTKKLTKHNLYFRMVKVPEVPLIFTNIPHPSLVFILNLCYVICKMTRIEIDIGRLKYLG